jgi:hypothetical protein
MKYVILTKYFGKPVYFMEHEGPGFSYSTDINKAKTYPTKKEATDAVEHLERESGMKAEVTRKL